MVHFAHFDNLGSLKNIAEFIKAQPAEYFKDTKILTLDSHKISVSNDTLAGSYKVAMVYLTQADLSGFNVCPNATPSCKNVCLGSHSGHASLCSKGKDYNHVRIARLRKTIMFHNHRSLFLSKLFTELTSFAKKCQKENVIPAFRFNGSSDIPFSSLLLADNSTSFISHFGSNYGMKFYDYTKNFGVMLNHLMEKPDNYHLTYSYTPENSGRATMILNKGGSVAVAFKTKKVNSYIGKKFLGYPIDNGDNHDLRFLDRKGVIVGLSAKGRKYKTDTSGFFVNTDTLT